MSIKSAVYDYLKSVPIAGGRIYPDILPQDPTYPAVTYRRQGVDRSKDFCGTQSHVRSSFQLDVYALTYAEADATSEAIRASVTDQRGLWGGSPGVWIDDTRISNEFDLSDAEPGLYRVSMDVEIWHQE